MRLSVALRALVAAFVMGLVTSAALAQAPAAATPHPGEALYQRHCAACHSGAGDAPATEAVRRLSRADIRYNLELGYMREIARDVPRDDLAKIIDWLPLDPDDSGGWVDKARCAPGLRAVRLDKAAARTATSFGLGAHNNRLQTAAQTGLRTADMARLELAWVMAFPQTATMRSQPVIVGDTLFIAATDAGRLYALDVASGCVKWVYRSDLTLRSSLSFAEATRTSPARIILGDAAGRVHAVDARTGARAWVVDAKLTDLNRITGAPVVHAGVVYAPLSAIEVNYAGPDAYGCCKGQGAVVALDQATGRRLWVGRTMEDARPTQKGRTGVQQWGPSGAIIWSTPVIDAKRGQIYVGTGENTSWPATDTSDAVIAYDMKTGARKWVFQATKADIWNYACGGRRGANCDWPGEYQSPDHDFGATAMLVKLKTGPGGGRDLVVAGQKSGVLWALDPGTGKLVWSNKLGRGSAGGGMRWGLAFDGRHIFAPQNDAPVTLPGDHPNWGPALHAVDAATGRIDWSYKPNARDCGDTSLPVAQASRPADSDRILPVAAPVLPPPRAPQTAAAGPPRGAGGGARPPMSRCRIGLAAAPLVVDGAVLTGSNGGMLRIFDAATGQVLFEYQTNRAYPGTLNGVAGKGGSLDSAPYVAGAGTLFVQSGYARFGQPPGNVLLAFRPKAQVAAK